MTNHIPFHDLGGNGSLLHFAHANGYHPNSYKRLLVPLTKHFRVIAYEARPFWKGSNPRSVRKWDTIANDLIRFMDENGFKNAIGAGHSLGGITTGIAALKRPDLFQKLVLLDPVLLPSFVYYFACLPPALKLKLIPVAKVANRRRDTWKSKEAAYDYLRKKSVFKHISDDVFRDVIEHGISENGTGARLRYSKEWEAQIYMTPTNIWNKLSKIGQATLAIRGNHSDVLFDTSWERWQAEQPNAQFHSLPDAGHLVPLEQPEQVAKLILEFAKDQ